MPPPGDASSSDFHVTQELLRRAKDGDRDALEALTARYLPKLQRWASGRLPPHARSLFDTADLVHETLLRAIQGLDRIEVRGPGGFQAYVRQAVMNRIRDQLRWARRRPGRRELTGDVSDPSWSPLENAIGTEMMDRYEAAMAELSETDRQLLHLRIELDYSYEEIAAIMERPSADAVRMGVKRALKKLARSMGHD
jgi:RNA polymerase sigma-70 factor (ECF subfamily)